MIVLALGIVVGAAIGASVVHAIHTRPTPQRPLWPADGRGHLHVVSNGNAPSPLPRRSQVYDWQGGDAS